MQVTTILNIQYLSQLPEYNINKTNNSQITTIK